jgi:thioredoxin-like negative regulator of GroEL
MKKPAAILLLVFGVGLSARADAPANWDTNYSAALAEAARAQKPALIFLTASWCGPCKMMSAVTLSDPAVWLALSAVQPVVVDIDEHRDLAAKYDAEAVPTFVLLSAAGEEVRRTTGFQPAADFLQWLTNGVSDAKEALIRQAVAREELTNVDRLLASTNAADAAQCATKLFDLCDGRDEPIARAAAERLKLLASRQPAALLDGLNDPRLAARIQVANALRDHLGDAFDVDPWAAPATRAAALEKWRLKLPAEIPNPGAPANPTNVAPPK